MTQVNRTAKVFVVSSLFLFMACEKENPSGETQQANQSVIVNAPSTNDGKYTFNEKVRLYDQNKTNYVEYVVRSNDQAKFQAGLEMLKNSTVTFFKSEQQEEIAINPSNKTPEAPGKLNNEPELIWEEIFRSDKTLSYEINSEFKAVEAANEDRVYVNVDASPITIQTICNNINICNASSNVLFVGCAHWNNGGWINTNSDYIYWDEDAATCEGHQGETGSYTRKSLIVRTNTSQNTVFDYTIYP